MRETLLDRLAASLREAASHNPAVEVPPVAVLWPDPERQWADVVPLLRDRLTVLTLGPFEPESLTGPAIWIRCVLAGLAEQKLPEGETPVVYLPGVSRQDMKAVEECPRHLMPLAELQYRCAVWSQVSHRDWTLLAYLQTGRGGLELKVATDRATLEALRNASAAVFRCSVEELAGRQPLNAEFFNSLMLPDLPRQVLKWMNDPQGTRSASSPQEWNAFRQRCREHLGLDPDSDGELTFAERLGSGDPRLEQVWKRFEESPGLYPGLPDLLRRARPAAAGDLFAGAPDRWPQENEAREDQLRQALSDLGQSGAVERIRRLESEHGMRRGWVWARLGWSPLAGALEHLAALADCVSSALPSGAVEEQAGWYCSEGWRADASALRALSCAGREERDLQAVSRAVSALYVPWLEEVCRRFQDAWLAAPPERRPVPAQAPGSAALFVDGLRMDTARMLEEKLAEEAADVELSWRPAPVPTVTATAKPAAAGLAESLGAGPELSPSAGGGSALTAKQLRDLLSARGTQVLPDEETGDPQGAAWTECGRLDEIGHVEGLGLAGRLDDELDKVRRRIRSLLDAGWTEVRVVTDHGWLLVPGELPHAELPEPATELRKGRCARLKPGASVQVPEAPWEWDAGVRIALAPGISCFERGKRYEHGGLSPQESVLPEIVVRARRPAARVSIDEVKWLGLRCRVKVSGDFAGLALDLRGRAADPGSSIAQKMVPLDAEGSASVVCPDESYEGSAAFLCVVRQEDPSLVVAQRHVTVGGDRD